MKSIGKNWLPLIQSNENAIKNLKSKTENFISPNINDSSQSIDVTLNRPVTATPSGDIQVQSITDYHIDLIDLLKNCIEELETQQNHLDIWARSRVNFLLVGITNSQKILVLKAFLIKVFILKIPPMLRSA